MPLQQMSARISRRGHQLFIFRFNYLAQRGPNEAAERPNLEGGVNSPNPHSNKRPPLPFSAISQPAPCRDSLLESVPRGVIATCSPSSPGTSGTLRLFSGKSYEKIVQKRSRKIHSLYLMCNAPRCRNRDRSLTAR